MRKDWHSNFVFVSPRKKGVQLPAFLAGDFGKSFLKEYCGVVNEKYDNHPQLMKLSFYEDKLCYQNLYSSIVTEQILNNMGLRSASFSDFNSDFFKRSDFMHSYYDLGVVFRGVGYPKPKNSKNFQEQLRGKGFEVNYEKSSIVVPLSGLDIDFNSEYRYGIGVKLREDAKPYYSNSFSHENSDKIFGKFDLEGPVFDKKNTGLVLRTVDSGLSRLMLKNNCILDSSNSQFSLSNIYNKTLVFKK